MFKRVPFYVFVVTISCLFCAPSKAQEKNVPCDVILATLYDKNYCARDYKLDALQEYVFAEQASYKGLDPEKSVELAPYQLLFETLWKDGRSKSFPNVNFEVSQKELDLFVSAYNSVHNAERYGLEMRLHAINQLLRNRKFNPTKRTFLRQERNDVRERLKILEAHANSDSTDQDTEERIDYQIKSTGQSIVVKWKENKALYKKYGGISVIIDKNIEPLEAILNQYQSLEDQGNLTIFDENYKAFYEAKKLQVQNALESIEAIEDVERIKKFYEVPYWLQDAVDAKEPYVQSLIKLYEEVGYRGHVPTTVKTIIMEMHKDE